MADLIEIMEKGLEKVANFLEITVAPERAYERRVTGEEPRHASVTFAPRGHVSQVLRAKGAGKEPRSIIGFTSSPYTLEEASYIATIEKPLPPRKLFDWRSDK